MLIAARLIVTVFLSVIWSVIGALLHPLLPALPITIASITVPDIPIAGETVVTIPFVSTFVAPLMPPLLPIAFTAVAIAALIIAIAVLLLTVALGLPLRGISPLTARTLHRRTHAATGAGHHRLALIIALAVHILVGGAEFTRQRPRSLDHTGIRGTTVGRLLRCHDDPIVVLGMLQIIFGHHSIAGRLCIPRERHVFLGDMGRVAANLNTRPIALVIA